MNTVARNATARTCHSRGICYQHSEGSSTKLDSQPHREVVPINSFFFSAEEEKDTDLLPPPGQHTRLHSESL